MRPGADRITACLERAGVVADVTVQALGVVCRVRPAHSLSALAALRGADYDVLVDMFATDTRSKVELTYHLRSAGDGREAYVRTRAGYDAVVQSASGVFPAAAIAEREAAELFGLTFAGNPDMHRLLTTSEAPDPLMRKSVRLAAKGGSR